MEAVYSVLAPDVVDQSQGDPVSANLIKASLVLGSIQTVEEVRFEIGPPGVDAIYFTHKQGEAPYPGHIAYAAFENVEWAISGSGAGEVPLVTDMTVTFDAFHVNFQEGLIPLVRKLQELLASDNLLSEPAIGDVIPQGRNWSSSPETQRFRCTATYTIYAGGD